MPITMPPSRNSGFDPDRVNTLLKKLQDSSENSKGKDINQSVFKTTEEKKAPKRWWQFWRS